MSYQLKFDYQGVSHEVRLDASEPSERSVTIQGKVYKILGRDEDIVLFKSYLSNPGAISLNIAPTWKASLEASGPYAKTEAAFQEIVRRKQSPVSFKPQHVEESSISSLSEHQVSSLNNVIKRASSLFGINEDQIREVLIDHQDKLAEAFRAKIARVVFPDEKEDLTRNGEVKDENPPLFSDMTLREKMVLGTLATILGKTRELENLCSQSTKATKKPGELVTIDPNTGRQLEVLLFGERSEHSVCILMEGGCGQDAQTWQKVIELLPKDSYGLSYSRAGEGLSDPSQQPGLIKPMLEDLSALISTLEREGKIQKPYVLVGHSLGGIIIQLYAKMHPGDIKGLVLDDSSTELPEEKLPEEKEPEFIDFHVNLMPRLTEELLFPISLNYATMFAESQQFEDTKSLLRKRIEMHAQALKEPFLGDLPVHVLTQYTGPSKTEESSKVKRGKEIWTQRQKNIFLRSSNATWTVAPKGVGHNIELQAPQLVAQAIKDLMDTEIS